MAEDGNFTPTKRGRGIRPLADLVEPCLAGAFAKQGFARTGLLTGWDEIAGERLAEHTAPLKIDWPRHRDDPEGPPEPATLVLKVESAFALEVQHEMPALVARINAHFGWRCVGRIVIRQGPVRRQPKGRPRSPVTDEAARGRVADVVAKVDDEALREALRRLGEGVAASAIKPS